MDIKRKMSKNYPSTSDGPKLKKKIKVEPKVLSQTLFEFSSSNRHTFSESEYSTSSSRINIYKEYLELDNFPTNPLLGTLDGEADQTISATNLLRINKKKLETPESLLQQNKGLKVHRSDKKPIQSTMCDYYKNTKTSFELPTNRYPRSQAFTFEKEKNKGRNEKHLLSGHQKSDESDIKTNPLISNDEKAKPFLQQFFAEDRFDKSKNSLAETNSASNRFPNVERRINETELIIKRSIGDFLNRESNSFSLVEEAPKEHSDKYNSTKTQTNFLSSEGFDETMSQEIQNTQQSQFLEPNTQVKSVKDRFLSQNGRVVFPLATSTQHSQIISLESNNVAGETQNNKNSNIFPDKESNLTIADNIEVGAVDALRTVEMSTSQLCTPAKNCYNKITLLKKTPSYTSLIYSDKVFEGNDRSERKQNNDFLSQNLDETLIGSQQIFEDSNLILASQSEPVSTQEMSTQTEFVTEENTKRRLKSYNITEDCILYNDNLIEKLLEEKPEILKSYNKCKRKMRLSEESNGVLAKTYIKRYRNRKMRIFKIKRRLVATRQEIYRPPEDQIIENFEKKLNHKEGSSSDGEEDNDSIVTPTSYQTDDSKSEVLSTGSSKLSRPQMLLRQGINKLSKDRSLIFSRFSDSAPQDFDRNQILLHVIEIICQLLNHYEAGRDLYFQVPRTAAKNCIFRDGRYQMREFPEYSTVKIRRRFNLMLFILNKVRILLETNTKLTKREIFYQLKTMITQQRITDEAIRDISRILNVGSWALNFTSQKGLVYGNLKLVMESGEILNCNVPGTLVPANVSEICEIQSEAYFILVVEKESIFQKLINENLPNRLTRPFILITGKGFSDINTQLFLKKLWMIMAIPVFILVDADPHGIAIMLTYRFGSIAHAHVSEHLAIPKAKWLGVFPSEINKLDLDQTELNKTDIKKINNLLQLECVKQNERIKKELETLLKHGVKTGIEGVMKTETYLSHRYLSSKFYTNDLI